VQKKAKKTAKQEARELLDKLPEDVSMDTILAELLFKQVILDRMAAVERGEVVSHEEAKEKLSRWLKSDGQ
jgi:hypothetical protein